MTQVKRPGGPPTKRECHFIFMADSSTSMETGGKIESLNTAIRDAIPHMQEAAKERPDATVLVRAVAFADKAWWHIGDPTPVADFAWSDLSANGLTAMGEAFALVAEALKIPPMPDKALPPLIVLISDGYPTDEDYEKGLQALLDQPWGARAIRVAIAAPGDHTNIDVLKEFIGESEAAARQLLRADDADQLAEMIAWVSTVPLKAALRDSGDLPVPGADADEAVADDAAKFTP